MLLFLNERERKKAEKKLVGDSSTYDVVWLIKGQKKKKKKGEKKKEEKPAQHQLHITTADQSPRATWAGNKATREEALHHIIKGKGGNCG